MNHPPNITLFHSPRSRSSSTLILLEELGVKYALRVLNMKASEQRGADYLAINPMGKVPALHHDDVLITEQVAIYLYLADLFADQHMAPALDSKLRGPYLRWMVFYTSCYEVAVADRAMKHAESPSVMSPYGSFDIMLATIVSCVSKGPYMLGDTFSAADLLWGNGLRLGMMFGIVPELPVIASYAERICSRPSFARVAALDAGWAKEHEAAAA